MTSSASLNFDILARDRASATFDKFGKSAEKAGGRLSKFGSTTKKGLAVLAGGAAIAGAGIALFAKSTIQSASDSQQSFGATQAVFGKYAKSVIKDSRKAADAYGLSANDFRESSNLIGSLLKNQGVAQDQLGDKTKSLVALGADLSATYGGKAKDAVEALGAAFKGEFDPLERYGVSLKQSTINTEAYRLANVKTQGEFAKLSVKQQRAATQQATMKILMQQTKDAQGQFAKQTGTLAEKQQILAAKFDNVKSKIGKALLPAISGFVGFLSDTAMPALDDAAGAVKDFFKTKGNAALKKAVEGIKTAADGIATAFDKAKTSAGKVKDAIGGLNLNNLDGNKIGKALGDAVLSGLQRLGQLAGKIGSTIGSLFAKVDWVGLGIAMGKQAPALVLGLAAGLLNFDVGSLFKGIMAHWSDILIGALAIAFAPSKFAGPLARMLSKIPFVGKFLAAALTWLNGIGGKFKSFAGDLMKSFWEGFTHSPIPGARVVSRILTGLKGIPGAVLGFYRSLYTRIGVWALDAFNAAGRSARTATGRLLSFVGTIPGRIIRALGALGRLLAPAGRAAIQGLRDGMSAYWGRVNALLGGLPGRIVGAVGSLGRTLWGAGSSLIQGLIDGITSKFGAVKSKLGELTGKLTSWKGPPKRDKVLLTPAGIAIMDSLLAGMKKRWTPIKDFLQSVTDKVQSTGDALKEAIGRRNDFASGFQSFSSSIFGRDPGQDANGNAIPETVAGIKAFGLAQRRQSEQLARDVQRLVGLGLSKSLLTQLQGQGSSGLAQIRALASSATRSDIAQINANDRATIVANQRAGMVTANAVYGGDIAARKRDADNAKAIEAAVERAIGKGLDGAKLHAELRGDDLVLVIRRNLKKKGKRDPFS